MSWRASAATRVAASRSPAGLMSTVAAVLLAACVAAACGSAPSPTPLAFATGTIAPIVSATPVAVRMELPPVRPGLTVAAAADGLMASGLACGGEPVPAADQPELGELVCRDEALGTEVRLAGRERADELRRLTVAMEMADLVANPPDRGTLIARAASASAALAIIAPHPRDQDALAKYLVSAVMNLSAADEDLYGGIHVAVTPPTLTQPTWRLTITSSQS